MTLVNETSLLGHTHIESGWYWVVLLINFVILLTGLSGNTVVMVGSAVFKAIKVDAIMKFLIELIAITDILILILYFVPMFATLVAHGWVFGREVCYYTAMSSEVPFYMQILLKTVASIYRLIKCRGWATSTVRTQVISVRIVAAGLFVISFAPLGFFITHNCVAIFVPEILRCISSQYSKKYGSEEEVEHSTYMTLLFILVPMIVILVTNTWIWCIVKRSQRNLSLHRRRGSGSKEERGFNKTAVMLTVMCCSFILCYIPTGSKFAMYEAGMPISHFFYLFHNYMLSVNSIINPILYLTMNRPFRKKLQSAICRRTRVNNISVRER